MARSSAHICRYARPEGAETGWDPTRTLDRAPDRLRPARSVETGLWVEAIFEAMPERILRARTNPSCER